MKTLRIVLSTLMLFALTAMIAQGNESSDQVVYPDDQPMVQAQQAGTCVEMTGFTVCFLGADNNEDGTSTWTYSVKSDDRGGGNNGTPALSHWTLGLCESPSAEATYTTIDSYGDVTGRSGVEYVVVYGTDPTTDVTGIKFEDALLDEAEAGLGEDGAVETDIFQITLNGHYGTTTVAVATKAGSNKQDATTVDTITGPDCVEVTPEPTDEPTDTPTDEPTDTPTDEPTDTPTDEPTDTPTDEPTDTPTPEPTATPEPSGSATCSFYAVHDPSSRNSQFFKVDFLNNAISALNSTVHQNKDLEGLDFHPTTGVLYATSGMDNRAPSRLYTVNPENGAISEIGIIRNSNGEEFREIASLAFRSDGTAWAFARKNKAGNISSKKGIIKIDVETGISELRENHDRLNAEGVAWDPTGTTLWLARKQKLYTWQEGGSIEGPYAISGLPNGNDIEGLGFGPDGYLLAGIHNSGTLNIVAIDVSDPNNLRFVTNSGIATNKFEDVESLTWKSGCVSSLGDLIWHDLDKDGVQDNGEPGFVGVTVNLYKDNGDSTFNPDTTGNVFADDTGDHLIASTTTDNNGNYKFENLFPGNYFVELDASNFDKEQNGTLAGFDASDQDKGDNSNDSDGDKVTHVTTLINLPAETDDMTWDFGFYEPTTAVTLVYFTTEANGNRVTLSWETGTEIDNAGFNIYRATSEAGPYIKVNNDLIWAVGNVTQGAVYNFEDTPGNGAYLYYLEDVDNRGIATMSSPVQTLVDAPIILRSPRFHPIPPR